MPNLNYFDPEDLSAFAAHAAREATLDWRIETQREIQDRINQLSHLLKVSKTNPDFNLKNALYEIKEISADHQKELLHLTEKVQNNINDLNSLIERVRQLPEDKIALATQDLLKDKFEQELYKLKESRDYWQNTALKLEKQVMNLSCRVKCTEALQKQVNDCRKQLDDKNRKIKQLYSRR